MASTGVPVPAKSNALLFPTSAASRSRRPSRHDLQLHLIERDLDVVGGHSDVGGNSDFGATAECVPVERGDHWARERRELIADGPHPSCHRRGVLQGPQRTQLLEVTSGDEGSVAGALYYQGSCALDR